MGIVKRIKGGLERVVLGWAMSLLVMVIERRLKKALKAQQARGA